MCTQLRSSRRDRSHSKTRAKEERTLRSCNSRSDTSSRCSRRIDPCFRRRSFVAWRSWRTLHRRGRRDPREECRSSTARYRGRRHNNRWGKSFRCTARTRPTACTTLTSACNSRTQHRLFRSRNRKEARNTVLLYSIRLDSWSRCTLNTRARSRRPWSLPRIPGKPRRHDRISTAKCRESIGCPCNIRRTFERCTARTRAGSSRPLRSLCNRRTLRLVSRRRSPWARYIFHRNNNLNRSSDRSRHRSGCSRTFCPSLHN